MKVRWKLLVLVVGGAALVGAARWQRQERTPKPETAAVDVAALRPQVQAFCGACHAVPHPDTFSRDAWVEEVSKGFAFYEKSGRHDLDVPEITDVIEYYRHLAPEMVDIEAAPPGTPSPLRFVPETVSVPDDYDFAAVSFLMPEAIKTDAPSPAAPLLMCDMHSGDICRMQFGKDGGWIEPLAKLKHPAHLAVCDYDGDGRQDLIAAELGSFVPADHHDGEIVWLRSDAKSQSYTPITLRRRLARIADVQPADVDGDGDLDLVAAEFGWRRTGRIVWLENEGLPDESKPMREHVIDDRHGAIHVPVIDLDNDGDLDFVALISQEHETIVAFINDGRGRFEKRTLFEAGDPSFGSTGIALVDLDGDGDIDVLYTNGDSLDTNYLKPYHAVQWLENEGTGRFQHRVLADLPGAMGAVAADLDGDGDLDIAAAAYLPGRWLHQTPRHSLDTLIWLEQTASGQFERHSLERSGVGHMSITAGDFDGDGGIDIVTGGFTPDVPSRREWVTLWRNQEASSTLR